MSRRNETDFWDTNIILGYTVRWDDLGSPVESYLSSRATDRELITSTRVFDEALGVVETQRKRAREAADRVFERFESSRYDTIEDVKKFVHREYAEDWGKVGPILGYIDYHDGAFLGLTRTDSERALRSTFEEISEDFDAPKRVIQRLKAENDQMALAHFDQGLIRYDSQYDEEYEELTSLLDDLDRDILLDSYHLVTVTTRSGTAFVTFDANDFVDNSDAIELCLPGVSIVDAWTFE